MTHLLGHRGSVGALTVRRAADWALDTPTRDRLGGGLTIRATGGGGTDNANADGTFEGWACVYGVQDSYGTTFEPGCFTAGGLDAGAYPLLAMHNSDVPLGIFTAEERDEGLWLSGEYDPTAVAQEWRARALSGSAPELSVGFVWLNDGGQENPDLITSARLVETSQITLRMAAVPGAGFQAVRQDDPDDDDGERMAAARRRAEAMLALRLADIDAWS